jgi:hypothetical protein
MRIWSLGGRHITAGYTARVLGLDIESTRLVLAQLVIARHAMARYTDKLAD